MSESSFRLNLSRTAVLIASAGVVVGALSSRVNAQTVNFNLYSTGENSVWSSAVQTPYSSGSTDTQWAIASTPGGGSTPALVTVPNPSWVPNSSTSQWLSDLATSATTTGSASGAYDYRTTFIIPTNVILSTAVVQFQYAVDDSLSSVLFNSSTVAGISGGGFSAMSATQTLNAANAAFQYGTNTIDFITSNGGGGQGLKVSFTNATGAVPASAAPEPSSLLLLMGVALPVGGMAAGGLRKRRARKS